jgi:hypothetical protein
MTTDPIARLADAQEAMIRALDSADATAVEAAASTLRDAVEKVRASGASGADLEARLHALAAQGNAAQARVNFLTDGIRRRIEGLAATRADRVATYRPDYR